MNIQEWALNWFNQQRNAYVTEPLIITTATGSKPVYGSVIEPGHSTNLQGIRVPTDHVLFIFNTSDLNGITLQRGIRILRRDSSRLYEVIIDKQTSAYNNDANNNEKVVPAKEIK